MRLVGRGFRDKKFLCEFKAIAADLNNFTALAICPHQLWIDGKGDSCMDVIAVGHFLERIIEHFLPIRSVFG